MGEERVLGGDLPSWFPFGKRFGEYSLDSLLSYAKERIDALLEFSSRKASEVSDQMLGKFNDPAGLIALMIAAAVTNDEYFTSWLSEVEGDLFMMLFNRSSLKEKVAMLRHIFGEILIDVEEISRVLRIGAEVLLSEIQSIFPKLDRKQRVKDFAFSIGRFLAAAPFVRAYRLVRHNRAIVIRGWAIAPLDEFFRASKSCYQDMLRSRIKTFREKIGKASEFRDYEAFGDEVISYWRSKRMSIQRHAFERDQIPVKGMLWKHVDVYPPCLRILYDQFMSTGYLPHVERLQLGLLLKALGMPLEEQLKFWYRAVDNVGLTWEQFLKKGGYYIRHLYGLEGSRKDYRPPKCETIITKYFCPFARMNFTELKELLRNINPEISAPEIDKIQEAILLREPRNACSHFLVSIVRDQNLRRRLPVISHPVQFSRIVYRYIRMKKYESGNGSSEGIQEDSQ